jgi:hypothetical protein
MVIEVELDTAMMGLVTNETVTTALAMKYRQTKPCKINTQFNMQ